MNKKDVLSAIRESGVIAVIRAQSADEAIAAVRQCIAGGIRCIEMTFTIPRAHRVIERVADAFEEEIVLGAGTVLDSQTARIAMLSGAEFVVAPHLAPDVAAICHRYDVAVACGVMTVTEAVGAMEAGCDLLKLFPASVLGPEFLRALHGPLPSAEVIPTGGVDAANAAEWIRAGAVALGAGGGLLRGDIAQNARELCEAVRMARGERG